MKEIFLKNCRRYFRDEYETFVRKLDEPCTHGFFLNTKKASEEEILRLIDFEYESSSLTDKSFYSKSDNIGKSKANVLGIIYPQGIEASLPALLPEVKGVKSVLDMCAAPGGKSINILNRLEDAAVLISNDVQYKRAQILSNNLERLGLDNVIITSQNTSSLADKLEGCMDLVIVDAPCSGEGMVRKYPEIYQEYSDENIASLAKIQSGLLDDAYKCLKPEGQLLYSTCTYSEYEDELQVSSFLERHPDMSLVGNTLKYSFINDTEGQFMALFKRNGEGRANTLKYRKTVRNREIEAFIKDNLDIENYYLYQCHDHYYLSLIPLYDLGDNVLRYGIYLGDIIKNRFEPAYCLYRSNSLKGRFFNTYDLSDEEYLKYVSGSELNVNLKNGYWLLTYKNHSLGYGKVSNERLKNKYPKGLRQ